MPKIKTKRGAAKRFKITASGKVKRSRANLRHINSHMSKKRKRHLRKSGLVAKVDQRNIKRLLPNG